MARNDNSKHKQEIYNTQKRIKDRISDIESKIKNIDKQLLQMENILSEIREKIDRYDENNKAITKSKLMRWYLEDLKIYNELNTIRIKYEEQLSKYIDQLMTSNFKLEDLEIKISKLDTDTGQLQVILEELEKKIQNTNIQLKEVELEYDDKFKI
jgi:predicted  nucleic acid-binding Zn-ribbon protein